MALFKIAATGAFSRTLKKLSKKHPEVVAVYETVLGVLQVDPLNQSLRHDIKKLSGVPAGDGQWRIRIGDYRLRYDVEGETVILWSINDRKDAYR